MQTNFTLKSAAIPDEKNARHVDAALKCLDERKVNEASREIRKIQSPYTTNPAVVQFRERLVAVLYGWEEEAAPATS